MSAAHGPAEVDDVGQDAGRFMMKAGMAFSQLAEIDARFRERRARQRAETDKHAATAAKAKMDAARGAAQIKMQMVMRPDWGKAVGRNDAVILDAARTAHAYRNDLPLAGDALGKIDQHVKAAYGVPLHQWQPRVQNAPVDIDEPGAGKDHPVTAQATVDRLERRDSAEAAANAAEAQADKSAKEARDAQGQTDQAVGSKHLAEAVNSVDNRHKAVGADQFRNAMRAASTAFPGSQAASCTRASAPKARKQRGQGRGQGRSRDLGM